MLLKKNDIVKYHMQKVQFQYIVFKYPVLCIFTHLYYLTPIHSDKELFSQFLWGTISSPSVCLSHFSLSMYCQVSLLSVASFPSVSFCPSHCLSPQFRPPLPPGCTTAAASRLSVPPLALPTRLHGISQVF